MRIIFNLILLCLLVWLGVPTLLFLIGLYQTFHQWGYL